MLEKTEGQQNNKEVNPDKVREAVLSAVKELMEEGEILDKKSESAVKMYGFIAGIIGGFLPASVWGKIAVEQFGSGPDNVGIFIGATVVAELIVGLMTSSIATEIQKRAVNSVRENIINKANKILGIE